LKSGSARHHLGILLGLVAGIGWGTGFVAARWLVNGRGVSPAVLVLWRFVFAAPFLWAGLAALAVRGRAARLPGARDVPALLGLSLAGTVVMANSGFAATYFTTSANVILVFNANAVFIALIAFLLGERVAGGQWFGILAGLAGVGIIGFAGGSGPGAFSAGSHLAGAGLAALGGLSWAVYSVAGRSVVARCGGLAVTAWCVTAGALMQVPVVLLLAPGSHEGLGAEGWWALFYLGLYPTALSFFCWFAALKFTDVSSLGPTQYVGTVVGVILGWALLGEEIAAAHFVGGALILLGIHFAVRGGGRRADKEGEIQEQ